MNRYRYFVCFSFVVLFSLSSVQAKRIIIAGDSTALSGDGVETWGWGSPFADYFDPDKVEVLNRAVGGRSSRTYVTQGHWKEVRCEMQSGDIVLIQFGHKDSGAINEEPPGSILPLRARGTLPGLGRESEWIDNVLTGESEEVFTYGHYLRKMVSETRAIGAHPVLLSPTTRNIWSEGRIERGPGCYRAWCYELAMDLDLPFVDVSNLGADRIQEMGQDAAGRLYPKDHTHTSPEGARFFAEIVVSGLRGLRPSPVEGLLSEVGRAIEADAYTWLNLPEAGDSDLPTLWLIGDSTVRNGRGDGFNEEWGWGCYLEASFDENRLNVVNRAVGGLSSRTYWTGNFWRKVKARMKAGDFLIMQFGHNDNGPINDDSRARGTLSGTGTESEEIDNLLTKQSETVHTYGWYLRQYVAFARSMGVTPVICSPVPRKRWNEDGTLRRDNDRYPAWAREVAEAEGVVFIDLHNLIADRYEELGKDKVEALFADAHTHTSELGARLNAEILSKAFRGMKSCPLYSYMRIDSLFREPTRFVLMEGIDRDGVCVSPNTVFTEASGYGYLNKDGGNSVRQFAVRSAEGNYRVRIEFGDEGRVGHSLIRAEGRRLILSAVETAPGEVVEREIIVNTRTHTIGPNGREGDRMELIMGNSEANSATWDEALTFHIGGYAPAVRSITIEAADEVPTIYLVGDSTVTDQVVTPYASWGQALPLFLDDAVAVANHAKSGSTMKMSMLELRLAKVFESMRAGDYLFIQFAHNDQKAYRPHSYVEAGTTYKAYLRVLIAEARLRGATPVLITSMERAKFDESGRIIRSHGEYPQAMREVAASDEVALVDLEPMSIEFYEALGPDRINLAFAYGEKDRTHHNTYGAHQLAKCVVRGLTKMDLDLVHHIREDVLPYNPATPDSPELFFEVWDSNP